jgi:hypothetical protein
MHVGFEFLTVVVMKNSVFWDIMQYNQLKIRTLLTASFVLVSFLSFNPEDGDDMFLRNYD